jgi:hypothetical protein
VPGSGVTGQPRFTVSVEMLVGLDYPTVSAYVQSFLQTAKTDGAVKRAIGRTGISRLPVSP